jgi:hypothetical protein
LVPEKYGSTTRPVLRMARQPLRAQLGAQRLGAAVLPDDGVVDRLAGAAVPQHRGLALVGDADGGDVARP